jgi:hypothetical protein
MVTCFGFLSTWGIERRVHDEPSAASLSSLGSWIHWELFLKEATTEARDDYRPD